MKNNNIKKEIRDLLNLLLGAFSLELRRIGSSTMPSWIDRIKHAKKLGFFPKVIFDGGAFQGTWSTTIAEFFPGAQIVLMEPNPFLQDTIKNNISKLQPPAIVINSALGDMQGESSFNVYGDVNLSSGASLLEHVEGKADTIIQCKVDTLDNISERLNLIPSLVKLDLQGGELLALKGGTRILKETELFIIEFGCLEAYKNRASPRDIIDFMYSNDYCLYDIVDCHYRPYDGALTGGDFFFIKNWSVLRRYKGYK